MFRIIEFVGLTTTSEWFVNDEAFVLRERRVVLLLICAWTDASKWRCREENVWQVAPWALFARGLSARICFALRVEVRTSSTQRQLSNNSRRRQTLRSSRKTARVSPRLGPSTKTCWRNRNKGLLLSTAFCYISRASKSVRCARPGLQEKQI